MENNESNLIINAGKIDWKFHPSFCPRLVPGLLPDSTGLICLPSGRQIPRAQLWSICLRIRETRKEQRRC